MMNTKYLVMQDTDSFLKLCWNVYAHLNISHILFSTAPPDHPLSLNVINTTHNAVILTWSPGFDGGLEQMYRIQYRKVDSDDSYTYVDVDTANATIFTVGGLELGSEYVFGIMGYNALGGSKYLQDAALAMTLSK